MQLRVNYDLGSLRAAEQWNTMGVTETVSERCYIYLVPMPRSASPLSLYISFPTIQATSQEPVSLLLLAHRHGPVPAHPVLAARHGRIRAPPQGLPRRRLGRRARSWAQAAEPRTAAGVLGARSVCHARMVRIF